MRACSAGLFHAQEGARQPAGHTAAAAEAAAAAAAAQAAELARLQAETRAERARKYVGVER